MSRDSEPTQLEVWEPIDMGDEPHQVAALQQSPKVTIGTSARFRSATHRSRAPGGNVFADGSSVGILEVREVAPFAVEVRLRPPLPPSVAEVDAVRSWLRKHRPAAATPRAVPPPPVALPPAPAPVQLVPVHQPETARGAFWPLAAVSLGLMAALLAAIIF